MVAITIIAFALVGLLGLHNRNLKMIGDDQNLTQATLLARQFITEMEVIEQWPDTGTSHGEFPEMPGFYWERDVAGYRACHRPPRRHPCILGRAQSQCRRAGVFHP